MLKNLDKLHVDAKKIIEPYCNEMLKIHQNNILSMLVYGSVIGIDYTPKKSNINLAIIFDNIKMQDLDKSLKLVNKGRKKKIIAPLFLTDEYMKTSSDVFPIEFLEMKENHVLIYGEDFLEKLEISKEYLRLQCEQQLKGKLTRLRQAYLEIGKNKKAIMQLILESFSAFIPVIRNLLRIKEGTISYKKEEILIEANEHFKIDLELFKRILVLKSKHKIPDKAELEDIFSRYMDEIFKLAMIADEMKII
ncbi:MAG: hypothetical protein QMD92_06060 [bacterium]|nr:hypothetical protein [bacterium]